MSEPEVHTLGQVPIAPQSELDVAARALLEASMTYWKAYRKQLGGAAVVWLQDTEGRLVLLTRGEYREALMYQVDKLNAAEGRWYDK